ncbi:tripartite tricarboxylate transporter substrate binding protein [bacterium]|nr:tripartite tricarboxylate transporter substrate binding protein [bacterium]
MSDLRRKGLFLLVSAIMVATGLAAVQSVEGAWPEKPITLYIPYSAGGSTDSSARALAVGMEKALGQQIVLINKTGGTGTVALGVLAGAKPDGYTLSVGVNSGLIWTPIQRKVPYKPLASFTNIFCYATAPTATVVNTDSPFKTWKDLVEYGRKNPGKLKYSTTGTGSPFHVGMEIAAKQEGFKWIHIPYKGTMPALTALLGKHVDACTAGPKFADYVKSGQMRIIGMFTKDRVPQFPDAPTFVEMGINVYNTVGLYSLFGPAGLDPAIVKKLEDAVSQAMETNVFKDMSKTFLMVPLKIRSEEFTKMLEENWRTNSKVLVEMGRVKKPATAPR